MKYKMTELTEELNIKKIVSIHYFEYMSDFTFGGESHNFWEFLCVDKGEIQITADREKVVLKRGDIIFHKPNEFHAVAANGVIAPNLVVITFDCGAPCMHFFEHKILTIGESERALIAQVIKEARNTFCTPMDNPYTEQLIRKENVPFGSEQMIKLHLEQLLIQLYRSHSSQHARLDTKSSAFDSDRMYNTITEYFEANIRSQLTLEKICRDNLLSLSQLKKIFREKCHCAPMEYFTGLKLNHAKQLIRNRQMNFTQIADNLGYTSVHYFSRQFKKETGMTPSEYAASIKQLSERH